MNLDNIDISKLPADVRKKFKQLQLLHAEKKIQNKAKNDFWKTYATQIVAIAPMTECKETPIQDPKRTTNTYTYGMNNQYSYNRTETKIEVDESRQS